MVHADIRILGFTAKYLYFSGPERKFRMPHDLIVEHETFSNGFGIMRDIQTGKPQSFRIWDGWFAFNLTTNLAR